MSRLSHSELFIGANEISKRLCVYVPGAREPTAMHFALPAETRDVVADVAVLPSGVLRRKMARASDINFAR